MPLISTYSVKIKDYNSIFRHTVKEYRRAVDFLIHVADENWDLFTGLARSNDCIGIMEKLVHAKKTNPVPRYGFDGGFPKFPSYLLRSAIKEAVGDVKSYRSNLKNWEESGNTDGKPSMPKAGDTFPCMYKSNMYRETGVYTAMIKIYTGKTWEWISVRLKKGDVDYILRRCGKKKKLAPTLMRRGKEWFLDFPFEETITFEDTDVLKQRILAVDLSIKNACTCCIMDADGTIHGRYVYKLPVDTDRFNTAYNRIRKAQQHGCRHIPDKWAAVNAVNKTITIKTAQFIMDLAVRYNVDVIVFEYLDTSGKKKGSRKERLHLWRKRDVQEMVEHKAHMLGIRYRRVCAWGTSRLAYDGSGKVERGRYMQDDVEKYNYSICVFPNGKTYHCDLNASYNIGARYFIREILKSLPEKERLELEAKVPSASRRSTSTLSTLISLFAEVMLPAA